MYLQDSTQNAQILLETTNVKLVQNFSQYLNPIKWLPILNGNKHGIRKIQRNVVILRNCFLSIDRIFPVILPILFDFIGRHSES